MEIEKSHNIPIDNGFAIGYIMNVNKFMLEFCIYSYFFDEICFLLYVFDKIILI